MAGKLSALRNSIKVKGQIFFRVHHQQKLPSSSFTYLFSSYTFCSNTMKLASSSSMKLSSTLVLLFFIIGAVVFDLGSATRCRARVGRRVRTGVCVPSNVCPRGRPQRGSGFCSGTICCIGPVFRCPGRPRLFVTIRSECRRGNDRGQAPGSASADIRCCVNPPAPLR